MVIFLVVGLIVVGAAVAYTGYYWQKSRKKNVEACSAAILTEASASLDTSKTATLKPVVAKIKTIKNYDKDQREYINYLENLVTKHMSFLEKCYL
jgi:Tfp pilus assembly protein PilE